jgi:ribosomal protein L7Ae-like RNA K-turn-binding protein
MRNAEDSVLGMIGLATKARKTASGSEACEIAVRSAKAKLVIVAKNTSENTKNPLIRICGNNNVAIREFSSKESLGKYTGKPIRAVVAITDNGFANRIIELIDAMDQTEIEK